MSFYPFDLEGIMLFSLDYVEWVYLKCIADKDIIFNNCINKASDNSKL